LEMSEESFFELNLSASDAVRVTIGTPIYGETEQEVLTNVILDQVGTRFIQRVAVSESDTYQVGDQK